MKEGKDLDSALAAEVLIPWEERCKDAGLPWLATDDLRNKWGKMILSQDETARFCGAFGLARCANLTAEEKGATEFYYNNWREGDIAPSVMATALLSGASPPHVFLQAYLGYMFWEGVGDGYWGLMSAYLRHPHCAVIPANQMFPEDAVLKIRYLLNAGAGRLIEFHDKGDWFEAQRIFKSRKYQPAAIVTEIGCLAKALRVDWTGEGFLQLLKGLVLEPVFEDSLRNHPALSKGGAPRHPAGNPTREAIVYFSGDDPVSSIWRFYNPLLVFPWLTAPGLDLANPLVYAGAMLAGMVPPSETKVKRDPVIQRIMRTCPLGA